MRGCDFGIKRHRKSKKLLDESLKELESSKGSVLTGIQKLSRAASILNDEEIS